MNDTTLKAPGWNGADWIAGAVRRNPEGLLLVGAGLALLMRSGGSRVTSTARAASAVASGGINAARDVAGQSSFSRAAEESSDAISQATATAWDVANAGAQKAKEVVGPYVDAASQYVRDARASVTTGSAQVKEQADRAWNQGSDLVRNQPLAIAALGIGAGLAIAALLPPSEMEEKVVGPARDRLADTARHAGDRVARAAGVAGSHLVEAIEKRGLTQSGVREMVTEAASSFTGALADHDAHAGEAGRGQEGEKGKYESPQTERDRTQTIPAAS